MLGLKRHFEAIVVGSGHAAVEAALALGRLGHETAVISADPGNVAGMPCNPSIGGPGKAQIVSEIDALGGEMALATDAATTELRILNASKGPAVQSMRAQVDKQAYATHMKKALAEARVRMIEGMVRDLLAEEGRVLGVRIHDGQESLAPAVILCTGVYLDSRIVIGDLVEESGPIGEPSCCGLSDSLRLLGFRLGRFKTGTSPRIKGSTVNWNELKKEEGAREPLAFSFMSKPRTWGKDVCYSTYTTRETHMIIRRNIERAPMFDGTIEGTGPRYCPSIEDKVMRFPQRERHQIFLERESEESDQVYILGLSTSLPEDVQKELVASLPGLRKAEITMPGYAIEYDYLLPEHVRSTLEVKGFRGLFTAGQINGTSGYEEAAAQGLIAGINAAMGLRGKEQLVLGRQEAYIGVLIDDIVSTKIEEPYRMLTSRAEYRLMLRQSNADSRLTPVGRRLGLVSDDRWNLFAKKQALMRQARFFLDEKRGGERIRDLLRNPAYGLKDFMDENLAQMPVEVLREVEIEARYAGFIDRQAREARRLERYLGKRIPPGLDLGKIALSKETIDKMERHAPATIGRALEVGVSPSDALVLLAYLRKPPFRDGESRGEVSKYE